MPQPSHVGGGYSDTSLSENKMLWHGCHDKGARLGTLIGGAIVKNRRPSVNFSLSLSLSIYIIYIIDI